MLISAAICSKAKRLLTKGHKKQEKIDHGCNKITVKIIELVTLLAKHYRNALRLFYNHMKDEVDIPNILKENNNINPIVILTEVFFSRLIYIINFELYFCLQKLIKHGNLNEWKITYFNPCIRNNLLIILDEYIVENQYILIYNNLSVPENNWLRRKYEFYSEFLLECAVKDLETDEIYKYIIDYLKNKNHYSKFGLHEIQSQFNINDVDYDLFIEKICTLRIEAIKYYRMMISCDKNLYNDYCKCMIPFFVRFNMELEFLKTYKFKAKYLQALLYFKKIVPSISILDLFITLQLKIENSAIFLSTLIFNIEKNFISLKNVFYDALQNEQNDFMYRENFIIYTKQMFKIFIYDLCLIKRNIRDANVEFESNITIFFEDINKTFDMEYDKIYKKNQFIAMITEINNQAFHNLVKDLVFLRYLLVQCKSILFVSITSIICDYILNERDIDISNNWTYNYYVKIGTDITKKIESNIANLFTRNMQTSSKICSKMFQNIGMLKIYTDKDFNNYAHNEFVLYIDKQMIMLDSGYKKYIEFTDNFLNTYGKQIKLLFSGAQGEEIFKYTSEDDSL
ncbi:hypothetical protein COBT_002961 [Conglomerata obtusa]